MIDTVGSSDSEFYAHTAKMPAAGTISGAVGSSHGWPWLNRCVALVPGVGQPIGAIPAAPALRASGAASDPVASNGTATMPAGVKDGDLALWYMAYSYNTTVQPSPPSVSGWTLLHHDQYYNGSTHRVGSAVYYRWLNGTEGGVTYPANWTNPVDSAWIDVWAGVDQASPFEGAAVSSGSNTVAKTVPAVTTTGADRTVLTFGIQTTVTALPIKSGSGGTWQPVRTFTETANSSSAAAETYAASMPSAGTISGAVSDNGGGVASNSYPWLYRAFALKPSYAPDPPPAADFSSPDELITPDAALLNDDELSVAWVENVAVSSRSLQRQVATAANYDGCASAVFSNDGAASTAASPVTSGGLLDLKCYRWKLTLTHPGAATSTTFSGVRYIVPRELALRHAPSVGQGDRASVSAVVLDRDREPWDGFTGTLTISTDAPEATFPAGATYTLNGPDDLTGHTFDIRFTTPGEHTITVRTPTAVAASSTITVTDTELVASAPETVYGGVPFMLEVAPTADSRPNPRYAGTVKFSSSDTTATYSRTSGTPPAFTFECNCDGAETFATRLTTLGSQTITIADDYGNSDIVTVNVVSAPGAIASPVLRLDKVKWDHGSSVDWYLTAVDGAQPFTVIEATNSCNQPASEVGLRVVPNTDRFVEFTTSVPKQICDNAYLSDIDHTVIIVDDAGHSWTLNGSTVVRRFTSVPNNTNFRMLDPGDPMAYFQVTGRPGGTEKASGPDGRSWAYGHDSLDIEFFVYEPTGVTELYIGRPGISGYVQPWQSSMTRQLPVGQSWTSFDDITHTCYIGNSWQGASSGWIKYATASGRSGARANGGGILPGAGSPTASCSDPLTGDDGGPLPDLLDALNPKNWPLVGDLDRFMAADPVDPFTGGFRQSVTDFSLGGRSPALQLSRTYRADRAEMAAAGDANAVGIFGAGWASSVDQRLAIVDSGDRVEWRGADGGLTVFARDSAGAYGGTRSDVTLTEDGGAYRVETNAGSALLFDANGRLTATEDRDGSQLTFAYDGAGHLDSLTDAADRTAAVTTDGAGRVTRVDLPDGRYVAFTYANGYLASARSLSGTLLNYVTDARGRLTEIRSAADELLLRNVYDDRGRVISQDDALGATTWFVYDADGLMTQVIDPRGALTTDCFLATGQLEHRIDALGSTTRWTYDSAGSPSSTTDALGGVTTFTYNADALPTKVTDPLGRSQTIAYDADGLVTLVTDHAGNTVTPTYDASGRPESVVRAEPVSDPDPASLEIASYTYNALGLPETITTAGGASTTLGYNATGHLTGVTDAEGRQITYTVDGRGLVTAMVDPLGNGAGGTPAEHTSTYTYDDAGRVLTATNPEGETTGYEYDEMGRLLETTSPLGTVTTNVYDADGRLTSTTTQLNDTETATTTFTYDVAGNLILVTDAEGRETEFEHDLLGRPVLQRDANGEEWLTEYDALGRVVQATDPTGRTTGSAYDAAGRLVTTTDAAGEDTTYTYDDRDQLVTVTDPLGRVTTNTYDWLGRQTALTNAEDEETLGAFNDAGDLVSITDAESKQTTFSYDGTHLLLGVVDAALGETTFGYDAAGRLIERTNARAKSESFTYDAVGRQTGTTDALGNAWTTAYDADGRIDSTVDGKGQTTDFVFDRGGRLLQVTPAADDPITYTYDDTGRQLTMSDGEGSSAFGYDAVGRLTSAARDSQTVTYTYDPAGRPTAVGYPNSGGSVDYTYDSAGRPATISDWASRITTMTYDDASRVTSMARPGGITSSFAYDDVDRILGIDHIQGGSALLALDYTYDDVGNVLTYADDTGAASFGYNDLHQLTGADYPGANDFSYAYDAVGNMTELSSPTADLTRTFNDGDQLITETSAGSFGEEIFAGGATGAWTDMANVGASDDADASAAPATESTLTMTVDDLDFSAVPVDALVTEVTVHVEWASSLASAELTLGAQARVAGVPVGTETTETANPTTDTVAGFGVADLDRADLETLDVVVRASRLAGDPVTASVDAVTVEVTYTLPQRDFTYDDNGSMTDDGAGRTFTYDAMGRMTGVDGTLDATYRYDGAGRRIGATVDGASADYLLDIRGLGSVLSDGTRRFLPGDPSAGYEEAAAWVTGLTNHQGSVLGYADASGLVGVLNHFDPYGAPLSGGVTPYGPGFTGQWTDATGLVDLRFRAYDPSLQSFFGRDTFGGVASAPLSANRYAYAMGNPLRFTDPSGHFVNEFMRHPGLYLSIGLQMLPVVGDAYSFATGTVGFDPIAGMSLSGLERGLAMAAIGPGGGFQLMGRLGGRAGGTTADIAGRSLDDLGGLGRSADDLGGFRRSGDDLRGGQALDHPSGGGRLEAPSASRSGDSVRPASRAADDAAPRSCSMHSFLPATRVLMADGSSKPIEDVEIGDWVIAADPETGEQGARHVTDIIIGDGSKNLVELTIDGDTITATDGHPFWVTGDDAWVDAEDLETGDRLLLADGSMVGVDGIREYTAEAVVHNLAVDDLHTYFVVTGEDAVLVHNCLDLAGETPVQPRGGVYSLRDRTGNVMRTGRSSNLEARRASLARDPLFERLRFQVEYKTDVYAEQRGLEQILYDRYPGARFDEGGLNHIRGISPSNPRLPEYITAGDDYLHRLLSQ